jgi:hypothetical protein
MIRFYNSVSVDGDAYVDLNEEVRDRKEDIIKLFTDDELTEEIKKREDGRSRYELSIGKLKTYIYNIEVDVDSGDVLNELDNCDLLDEVRIRGLNTEDVIETDKYSIRKVICKALGINEMYDDEEIFEMLREIWKVWR